MRATIHGGHGPHGKLGAGAVGFCSESMVDRQITSSAIKYFKQAGVDVTDCTVNEAGIQSVIISKIKKNINSVPNCNINLSIHLNANKKVKKDGVTKGVECWIYPGDVLAANYAGDICASIAKLGLKNRGVKTSKSLGVLKGIKNGGANILVECFFCDDEDDYLLYSKLGSDAFGKAIAEAVVGNVINQNEKKSGVDIILGKYIINDQEFGKIDLGYVFEPEFYKKNGPFNAEEKASFASMTDDVAFTHFRLYGMREGRRAGKYFDVNVYKKNYKDLQNVYGSDLARYYKHYCLIGHNDHPNAV